MSEGAETQSGGVRNGVTPEETPARTDSTTFKKKATNDAVPGERSRSITMSQKKNGEPSVDGGNMDLKHIFP